MQKILIIFIKNPIEGTVKTRLAESIGDKKALSVYRDLLKKCRSETLAVEAERHLFYFENIEDDAWSNQLFNKHTQSTGDLGTKMKDAFHQLLQNGSAKTIIIGSDCYDLTADIIEQAFIKLENADLVIGPANDGGYYLLGMKNFYPEIFEDIDWSTEIVLKQTLKKAEELKLSVVFLQELIDIDNLDDLKQSGYK